MNIFMLCILHALIFIQYTCLKLTLKDLLSGGNKDIVLIVMKASNLCRKLKFDAFVTIKTIPQLFSPLSKNLNGLLGRL